MLRWFIHQSWPVAGLLMTWFVMSACANPNNPVSAPATNNAAAGVVQGVQGRVVSADGKPIVGAVVDAKSLDGAAVPEMLVVTDDDGRYLWALRPGEYEISVSAQGYETAAQRVTVRERTTTTLDFTLTRAR
jgi:uncharacterized membrane protein